MAKLRRALVEGAPSRFWAIRGGDLLHQHPNGYDWVKVPVAHLSDPMVFADHIDRLCGGHWITADAVDELRRIRAGWRHG